MSSLSNLIRNSSIRAGNTAHVMPKPGSGIVSLVTAALQETARAQGSLLPDLWPKDAPPSIILVPDVDWIAPITVAIDELGGAVHPTPSREKSDVASDLDVILRIEDGASVWVATDLSQVPQLAKRTAERVVTIAGMTSSAIADAITKVTGEQITIENTDWEGLSLALVGTSIRCGATAQSCRERLLRWAGHIREETLSGKDADTATSPPVFGPAASWIAESVTLLDRLKTGSVPKTLLRHTMLVGQPGSGKTTLTEHLAQSAGVPLERISVAALFAGGTGYLDSVVRQIVTFFETLRAHGGPAIGVIEEIDALSIRAAGIGRNDAYWTTVVTSFLLAIDDLNASDAPILLVASTNRPQDVDPAICRPGRIGRIIEVGPPETIEGVSSVVRYQLGSDLPEASLTDLARRWLGESQAELTDRVVAARTRAVLAGRPLALADLDPDREEETAELGAGLRRIALHEAAHAVVAHCLSRQVETVTLHMKMSANGLTRLTPRLLGATFDERLDEVCIACAGRAADAHFGNRVDDGSARDMINASLSIANLYLSTGLSETLLALPTEVVTRELTTNLILQDTVEMILQDQMNRASNLVVRHHKVIERMAGALLERRALSKDEIAAVLAEGKA